MFTLVIYLTQEQVVKACDYGNEFLSSIKCRELVNQLHTFQLWIKDQLMYKKINSLIATASLLLRGPMNPHMGGITSV